MRSLRRDGAALFYEEAQGDDPLHEMFPEVLDGKTVGSGHFCQLEVPEQVNAMIDRFLAIT